MLFIYLYKIIIVVVSFFSIIKIMVKISHQNKNKDIKIILENLIKRKIRKLYASTNENKI